MLREIGKGRPDGNHGMRRWFQDGYFDLYVWHDACGAPAAFQLCYDRSRNEGAISWDRAGGFAHDRVDDGERSPKRLMTPLLRADGAPPYFRLYDRFLAAGAELPEELRAFLIGRLREYRFTLYGTPRKPRRMRRAGPVDTSWPRE